MTREEFAQVTAYIAVGCGKDLSPEAHEVYFDLLGDLPFEAMKTAARRVLIEHKWATFPSVAELRQAAVETTRGEVKELCPAEAWATAWWIVGNCDPEVEGSFDRACRRAKAPPVVVEAIRSMSLTDLCFGDSPVGVIRGQFFDVFEQLQARERRTALLPPAVLNDIRERQAIPSPASATRAIVDRLADSFTPRSEAS